MIPTLILGQIVWLTGGEGSRARWLMISRATSVSHLIIQTKCIDLTIDSKYPSIKPDTLPDTNSISF